LARVSKELYDQQKRWMDAINRAVAVRKDWKDRFRVDLARDYRLCRAVERYVL
jgi:hypothetical protein